MTALGQLRELIHGYKLGRNIIKDTDAILNSRVLGAGSDWLHTSERVRESIYRQNIDKRNRILNARHRAADQAKCELAREIDGEAQFGVLLIPREGEEDRLGLRKIKMLSGDLVDHIDAVAEQMFPEEWEAFERDTAEMTEFFRGYQYRAHFDSRVTEVILEQFRVVPREQEEGTFSDSLRAIAYPYWEMVLKNSIGLEDGRDDIIKLLITGTYQSTFGDLGVDVGNRI